MEHLGLWGIIPPLLTIILALVTKDVILSLFLGILSGAIIVAGGNPGTAMMNLTDTLASSLADSWNIRIFMFCGLLGALVGMLARTGAAQAFGSFAAKNVKGKTGALLFTWMFGLIIFIDDYFNSLTIGTVMRPLTDRAKVSRAKLAYILDSTAAPVCIMAPISSWVVTVMSYMKKADGFDQLKVTEFSYFIRVIPFNFYAIFAILMVLFCAITHRDFGPMARSEERAESDEGLFDEDKYGAVAGNVDMSQTAAGKGVPAAVDMLFPILLLIVVAIAFFPISTWMGAIDGKEITTFSQAVKSMSLSAAFNDCDASKALLYSIVVSLAVTYVYYISRRLLTVKTAADAIVDGVKSMVPALVILAMAWSIGTIIKSNPADGGLGLSKYLSEVVTEGSFPLALLPAIVFVLSCLIAFSTGTSWGTMAIMIPITFPIALALAQKAGLAEAGLVNATLASLGAVLGGAIFGDHSSPISDTTILSSTGASCPHLEHVATQVPYAIFIAIVALAGHLVAGVTYNPFFGLVVSAVVFVAGIALLPKLRWGKAGGKAEA